MFYHLKGKGFLKKEVVMFKKRTEFWKELLAVLLLGIIFFVRFVMYSVPIIILAGGIVVGIIGCTKEINASIMGIIKADKVDESLVYIYLITAFSIFLVLYLSWLIPYLKDDDGS